MICGLLRAALFGTGTGWVCDWVLTTRAGGGPRDPIRSLIVIDAPIAASTVR